MLILREPIRLKSLSPMVKLSEGFSDRLEGNYKLMQAKYDSGDLFYLLSQAPELYVERHEMTTLVEKNQNQIFQNIQMEMIHNLFNRLMMAGSEGFTYQDSVFVQSMMGKLGLSNVSEFMSQLYEMQRDIRQNGRLLELYGNKDAVRMLMQSPEENRKVEHQRSPLYVLHDKIFKRLQTGMVYHTVAAYQKDALNSARVTNQEARMAEQIRTSAALKLNMLENRVLPVSQVLSDSRVNIYEEGVGRETGGRNEWIKELVFAVLLNISDQLYQLRCRQIRRNRGFWFYFEGEFRQTFTHTLKRFFSCHWKKKFLGRYAGRQYQKIINELRRKQMIQLEKILGFSTAEEMESKTAVEENLLELVRREQVLKTAWQQGGLETAGMELISEIAKRELTLETARMEHVPETAKGELSLESVRVEDEGESSRREQYQKSVELEQVKESSIGEQYLESVEQETLKESSRNQEFIEIEKPGRDFEIAKREVFPKEGKVENDLETAGNQSFLEENRKNIFGKAEKIQAVTNAAREEQFLETARIEHVPGTVKGELPLETARMEDERESSRGEQYLESMEQKTLKEPSRNQEFIEIEKPGRDFEIAKREIFPEKGEVENDLETAGNQSVLEENRKNIFGKAEKIQAVTNASREEQFLETARIEHVPGTVKGELSLESVRMEDERESSRREQYLKSVEQETLKEPFRNQEFIETEKPGRDFEIAKREVFPEKEEVENDLETVGNQSVLEENSKNIFGKAEKIQAVTNAAREEEFLETARIEHVPGTVKGDLFLESVRMEDEREPSRNQQFSEVQGAGSDSKSSGKEEITEIFGTEDLMRTVGRKVLTEITRAVHTENDSENVAAERFYTQTELEKNLPKDTEQDQMLDEWNQTAWAQQGQFQKSAPKEEPVTTLKQEVYRLNEANRKKWEETKFAQKEGTVKPQVKFNSERIRREMLSLLEHPELAEHYFTEREELAAIAAKPPDVTADKNYEGKMMGEPEPHNLQFFHKETQTLSPEVFQEQIGNSVQVQKNTEKTTTQAHTQRITVKQQVRTQEVYPQGPKMENFNEALQRGIQRQMDRISDQVYRKLEKKLSDERKRRGC